MTLASLPLINLKRIDFFKIQATWSNTLSKGSSKTTLIGPLSGQTLNSFILFAINNARRGPAPQQDLTIVLPVYPKA